MRYTKLNKNWNAEPNAPNPQLELTGEDVVLKFDLNPFMFDYIDELDKGRLEFNNVHTYRLGTTNDEGYYRGQFRYTNNQLPWGEFYELSESNWQVDFPSDRNELQPITSLDSPRHYIFFFRDETFECIADSFHFEYLSEDLEQLNTRYPEGYMNHFLAMYSANNHELTQESIQEHCEQYKGLEGQEEFINLKLEIEKIKENQDQPKFVKLVNSYNSFDKFNKHELQRILEIVERN